jgi:ABC-type nitrate/sulfonate/bicarbonate transport system substrate-binding protein
VSYEFSGKRNLELLRAGGTDIALMALTPLVLDALADPDPGRPDDPVILASVVHATRLNQVVTLAERKIERPAELAGRRVGLMEGTNAEFVWWLFAAYHGFDPDSTILVDQPIESLLDAVVGGGVDAAVIWEPWTSRLRERVGDRLRLFSGSNVYTAKWVVVALRSFVERQPERARAVLAGYRDAVEFIDREPGAAMRLYADHDDVPVAMLEPSWDDLIYELSLDWSLIATLQQQLDWGRSAGYATSGADPEVLALLHPGPLQDVAPGSVSVPGTGILEGSRAP